MRIALYILCLLICCKAYGEKNDWFELGNKAYKEKNYVEAIAAYEQLIEQGLGSAQLFHNLGTACVQNDQLGKAILFLEKANRAKPGDVNISKNLALAREEIDSPVIEIPEFFLLRYWKSLANGLPPLGWFSIQLLSTLLLFYSVFLWRLKEDEALKLKGFGMMLVAAILLLLSFFASRTAHDLLTNKESGIVMQATTLMSGADARSEEIEPLSEGVKVKILDSIDDWYKVRLMNKEQGWIQTGQIAII